MKKILITGAGGFIGSHLTERCIELGHEVTAFVRYNSRNDWGWLSKSQYVKEIDIIAGDIRDYDSVFSAMKGFNTVFHLAALIGIPYSYVSPLAYLRTNIEGTHNVLQSAKKLEYEEVMVTSTSETYGTAQYIPIDEKHPSVGQSPYSATKISADQLSISYYRSFQLPVKVVRPFNTYGPRQSARAIIPTIIIQILNKEKEINLGSTYPTRDFSFVEDTVNGFIEIHESKDLYGEATNIGMRNEISMEELAKLIAKLMNCDLRIKYDSKRIRPENSEVERLLCDNQKILKYTNWKPTHDLESGLAKTIDWFRSNYRDYRHRVYNI